MKTLADIQKITVLGAGTMGPGIAQTYAMGGYQVTMWTRSEKTRDKAIAALHSQLETFAQEGEIAQEDIETTRRIGKALAAVEISLIDHIIVADDDFVSLANCGYIDQE